MELSSQDPTDVYPRQAQLFCHIFNVRAGKLHMAAARMAGHVYISDNRQIGQVNLGEWK